MKRVFILLILLTLLLVTSCAKLESAGYEMGEKLGAKLLGEEIEGESVDFSCILEADSLISSTVELLELGDDWYLKEYVFADGTTISPSIRYRLGEEEGENVKYRYPKNLLEPNTLRYTKQYVGDDGVIKGDFTFKVKLTLVEADEEPKIIVNTKYGKEIRKQTYIVVEQEILNCIWPK